MGASELPVIPLKQQKQSLSAKKNAKRETIKNVLTTPFTRYWPILNEADKDTVIKYLETCLPKMTYNRKIPWKEIKSIPKEQRKEFRKKFTDGDVIDNSLRKILIFGINAVTRKLEAEEANAVLISDNISPQFMVKHVINLSVLKNVPVLVVPDLKQILKERTGVSAACFCLSKSANDTKFGELIETISSISKTYPIPENHIGLIKKNNVINNKGLDESDFMCFEDTAGFESNNEEILAGNNEDEDNDESREIAPQNGWYLPKVDTKRAFIPEIHHIDDCTGEIKDTADFMSFSNSVNMEVDVVKNKPSNGRYYKKKNVTEDLYVPLKVKRIKSDKNRVKRKLENIKKR